MSVRLTWANGMVAELSHHDRRWRIPEQGAASDELRDMTLNFLSTHFGASWSQAGPAYEPDRTYACALAAAAELGVRDVENDPPDEPEPPKNAVQ